MEKFNIGDKVQITNLDNPEGGRYMGRIGHIGVITRISSSSGMCYLTPDCGGACWMPCNFKYYDDVTGAYDKYVPNGTPIIKTILISVPKI